MPYSGADDPKLPDNIKKMGAGARAKFVGAFNGAIKDGKDEAGAFAIANAAAKKSMDGPMTDDLWRSQDPMPTSWDQLTLTHEAVEAQDALGCLSTDFQTIQRGILGSPDMSPEQKKAALIAAAQGFQERVGIVAQDVTDTTPEEAEAEPKSLKKFSPGWFKSKISGMIGKKADVPDLDHPVSIFKDKAGNLRFMMWASNNFRDRDNPPELIEEKAHHEFIETLDAKGWAMPEAWLWHQKGTRWGVADWADYVNGFLVFSGTVDKGMEPVAHGLAAWKGELGVSHGFVKLGYDDATKVIQKYRTFEISPLPREAAANAFTSIEILQKELVMDDKKKGFLTSLLGEDAVKKLVDNTAAASKALHDLGIEAKAKKEPTAEEKAAAEKAAEAEKAKGPAVPAEVIAIINKAVAESPALKALAESLGEVSDVLALIPTMATALGAAKKDIELFAKSDDERFEKWYEAKKNKKPYVASKAQESTLTKEEEEAEKNKHPAMPDFFKSMVEAGMPGGGVK